MKGKLIHQLEKIHQPFDEVFEEIANKLARRIFDPYPSRSDSIRLYINSTLNDLVDQRYGISLESKVDMSRAPEGLGPYEAILYSKLVDPTRNVVCVVGAMGCGKSTTFEYLYSKYLKNRSHHDCPRSSKCQQERLFVRMSFDREVVKNITRKTEAEKVLRLQLCHKLRSSIASSCAISEAEELGGFWNTQFKGLSEGSESIAFSAIASDLNEKVGDQWRRLTEIPLSVRREVRNNATRNQRCHLDYLIRLWRYAREKLHELQPGCGLIVIDDIDRSSAVVQSALLDIVSSHAEVSSSTWLLLMRPETFDALDADLDTIVVDRVPHLGPAPVRVMIDRLERFKSNPASFRAKTDIISDSEFEEIRSGLCCILDGLKTKSMYPLYEFLSAVGGFNIRNTLRVSQTLARLRYSQFPDIPITAHNMIRILIRDGRAHYERRNVTPVENLYHVAHEPSGLLVKTRILAYLEGRDQECAALGSLRAALRGFGYTDSVMRVALNELMVLRRRLVRSSGLDWYKTDSTFRRRSEDLLILSRIGKGYHRYLTRLSDYTEEVMVDSLVPQLVEPNTPFQNTGEKLRVLYQFLRHMLNVDVKEMRAFLEDDAANSQRLYFELFGHNIVSLGPIQAARSSISAILSWSERSKKHMPGLDRSLLANFDSLETMALRENQSLLATKPST